MAAAAKTHRAATTTHFIPGPARASRNRDGHFIREVCGAGFHLEVKQALSSGLVNLGASCARANAMLIDAALKQAVGPKRCGKSGQRTFYNLGLDELIARRVALEARKLGPISINARITAVRKPAIEAGPSR